MRTLWLFVVLAVSAFFGVPASAQDCVGPSAAARPLPPANVASDRIVPVRVKGMRFDIPRSYFRYPPDCGEEQTGILLRAVLPDMVPATPENEKRLYDVEGGWGPLVQFIYGNLSHSDLNRTFQVYSSYLDRSLDYPLVNGLKFATRPDKLLPEEVYFEEQDGGVRLLILCSQSTEVVKYPGCRQMFLYRGEIINITFDRKHLPEWRGVQRRVLDLLDRFAVDANAASTIKPN